MVYMVKIKNFITKKNIMCLAVPGQIIKIENEIDEIFRIAKVSFNGIIKEVNLAMVPEAKIGDYVLVHVGSAISIVDEEEAKATMDILLQMEDLDELENDPD